jgi:hypothetical protein
VITTVRESKSGRAVEGAQVALDFTMPEHGHGMTTKPEHEALGAGRYRSRGLKLHMPGRWRLSVEAEVDGSKDAAAVPIEQPPRGAT